MIVFGSARISENGSVNGAPGDAKQTTTPDYSGEVSMQKFYVSSKGWYVIRPIQDKHAERLSKAMFDACNNKNIGYSQNDRLGVIKNGTKATIPTNCDCSSLVRECVREATSIDPGNFTTADEKVKLMATGLFIDAGKYNGIVYDGDILVTCAKGHTGIIVSGSPRNQKYYPAYTGTSTSIVDALKAVGETDTSPVHRVEIGNKNGIKYVGTPAGNTEMLKRLKTGTLLK